MNDEFHTSLYAIVRADKGRWGLVHLLHNADDFCLVDLGSPWPIDCDDSEKLMSRYWAMAKEGAPSGELDFDCEGRDGLFDVGQRFAVWDRHDVQALVGRLTRALVDSE